MFNHKYNTDNVFSRSVIVGLINLLNNKIQIPNVLSDNKVDVIEIPWFFSQGGDERFMQDYFIHWADCLHPNMVDGNYDIIPRGNVQLTAESINSGALTHRFIRGKRVREVGGQLHTFSSYMNSIPMNYTFEATLKTDTYLDALKISQTIREIFYSTQVFYTRYDGFKIPCQAGFPEDIGIEKTFEYTYGDDTHTIVNFTIEVETYQPVLDKSSERHDSNRIHGFGTGISLNTKCGDTEIDLSIPRKSIDFSIENNSNPGDLNTYYISDTPIDLQWTTLGTITKVDIYYRINNGSWIQVERFVQNKEYYEFYPPKQNDNYDIMLSESTNKEAILKPVFDDAGSLVDIKIVDGGNGYTNSLIIDIEQKNFTGDVAEVQAFVEEGTIKSIDIVNSGSGYKQTNEYQLDLKVEDSRDNLILDELNGLVLI